MFEVKFSGLLLD